MAGKISTENKLKYQEQNKQLKEQIAEHREKIKAYKAKEKESEKFANYYYIASANEYLNVVNDFINLNTLSMNLMKSKNEGYLNDARKNYFNALIELEKVFSSYIDTELKENEEILNTIKEFNPERKLKLIQKLGYALEMLEQSYGANTKWKWSFVDMECRYITVLKNMIDWKKVGSNNDPRMPFYEEQEVLSRMAKERMLNAAERAREKYELSTHEIEDMRKATGYLHSLRRIFAVFGESDQAEEMKKKAKAWTKKIEADLKAKDRKMRADEVSNKKKKKKKSSLFG